MPDTFLVITSIANSDHPILKQYAKESVLNKIPFIVIGDTKSPDNFFLKGCDFYSIKKQKALNWELAKSLPVRHYARKNLGYLIAMSKGAKVIIETDDDNLPYKEFWDTRKREVNAHKIEDKGWVNVYKYFTESNIWPRGFALDHLLDQLPEKGNQESMTCPIQQGLADENPDIDAIYRLILPLPLNFDKGDNIAIGNNTWCPFNSQNTTWFKEAFPLLYLPSYCSFRMTDIWRSFVAQRISWTCGWSILFHKSTVWQERNNHNLMIDFKDEIPGYLNNNQIINELQKLPLKPGIENISDNLIKCYEMLVGLDLVWKEELPLVNQWVHAINELKITKPLQIQHNYLNKGTHSGIKL